jgi:hypothetical protein
MIKKATRTGNSIALVLDKPMRRVGARRERRSRGLANGQVIVITPKRSSARERKFRNAAVLPASGMQRPVDLARSPTAHPRGRAGCPLSEGFN